MGHRHCVFQSIAAFAGPDDNYGESAGWRFLCLDLNRTLPWAGAPPHFFELIGFCVAQTDQLMKRSCSLSAAS